jgi:hypothetical protein
MLSAALALLLALPDLHVRPPPDLRVHPTQALGLHLDVEHMTKVEVTKGVIVGVTVAAAFYEALLVYQRDHGGTTPPTISQVMLHWSQRYATVPWLVCGMAGHWFWPAGSEISDKGTRANAMTLAWLTAGVIGWDIIEHSGRDKARGPAVCAAAFVSGHLFAGQ